LGLLKARGEKKVTDTPTGSSGPTFKEVGKDITNGGAAKTWLSEKGRSKLEKGIDCKRGVEGGRQQGKKRKEH